MEEFPFSNALYYFSTSNFAVFFTLYSLCGFISITTSYLHLKLISFLLDLALLNCFIHITLFPVLILEYGFCTAFQKALLCQASYHIDSLAHIGSTTNSNSNQPMCSVEADFLPTHLPSTYSWIWLIWRRIWAHNWAQTPRLYSIYVLAEKVSCRINQKVKSLLQILCQCTEAKLFSVLSPFHLNTSMLCRHFILSCF